MPTVLTNASQITCPANGQVSTSAAHKLKVDGQSVLTLSDIQGKSVEGCLTPKDESKASKPCAKVASASGSSSKLKVNGVAVANSTFSGSADGSANVLSASPVQSKLNA